MTAPRLSPGAPLSALGLPPALQRELHEHGIVTQAHLYDMVALEGLPTPPQVTAHGPRVVQALGGPLAPELQAALKSPPPAPTSITGLVGPLSASPPARARRRQRRHAQRELRKAVRQLKREVDLPTSKLLVDYMNPVRNQGTLGACGGFGSNESREFVVPTRELLSPLYPYAGAKAIDGRPDVEGTWQTYCFQWMSQVGQVLENRFPYTDRPSSLEIGHLNKEAADLRIEAFLDLLLDEDDPEAFASMPFLLKCALTGDLTPDLGPQTVSISIAVYESMRSATTRLFGLVTLPMRGEKRVGGHALCLVGYVDADDPTGMYDTDYFICKNSWGTEWASENPLGLPGYALIPASYFASPERLWEALMVIAEPSPARQPDWQRALQATWGTSLK